MGGPARSHLPHDFILGDSIIDAFCSELPCPPLAEAGPAAIARFGPEAAQEFAHEAHVGKPWRIHEGKLAIGKQARGHEGKRRIFRAADGDFACQAITPSDANTIHTSSRMFGSVSTLM